MTVVRKTLTPTAAALMQQALHSKPNSLDDLVVVSRLAKPTVARYVKELMYGGMLRVAGWALDSRGYPTIRQFGWGAEPDAPCPVTSRTPAERMRILRAARKAGDV